MLADKYIPTYVSVFQRHSHVWLILTFRDTRDGSFTLNSISLWSTQGLLMLQRVLERRTLAKKVYHALS